VDQLLYTLGFATLSSWLFGGKFEDRLAYVGIGIAVFAAITQSMLAGLESLVGQTSLRNSGMSFSGGFGKEMLVVLVTFGFRVLPLALIIPFTSYSINLSTSWFFLSIVLGGLSATALGMILAISYSRFRDLNPAINLISRLAFFASPVFWHVDSGSQPERLNLLTRLNPFAQYLDVLRSPLLGSAPSTYGLIFVFASTVLLCAISAILLNGCYRRIPYMIS